MHANRDQDLSLLFALARLCLRCALPPRRWAGLAAAVFPVRRVKPTATAICRATAPRDHILIIRRVPHLIFQRAMLVNLLSRPSAWNAETVKHPRSEAILLAWTSFPVHLLRF